MQKTVKLLCKLKLKYPENSEYALEKPKNIIQRKQLKSFCVKN